LKQSRAEKANKLKTKKRLKWT